MKFKQPKSRQSSLIFDNSQMNEIYNGGIPFDADVSLPPDIGQQGRRDSTELDEVPNGGVRGSDDEDDDNNNHAGPRMIPNNNMLNGNGADQNSDSDSDNQPSYDPNINNGIRNEYPINNDYIGGDMSDPYNPGSHNRIDTNTQIAIAQQVSLQQQSMDEEMENYREEIKHLKEELAREREENERLLKENEEIKLERDRYLDQSREIQDDWDRMSGYMNQILSEVNHIESQRKQGQDISTPTPKLHDIFEKIQNTISRNNTEDGVKNGKNVKPDLYENVADLFTVEAPKNNLDNLNGNNLNVFPSHDKRKLSFGAVNELFASQSPQDFLQENGIEDNDATQNNQMDSLNASSSSSLPSKPKNNQYLAINEEMNEHEKRLSYGGVGLLFDANAEFAAAENERINEQQQSNNDVVFNPNNFPKNEYVDNPLKISFKPTYDGIASLFDENNDILGTKSSSSVNKHSKKAPSYGGDIVELFTNPNNQFASQNVIDEEVEEEEEENSNGSDQDDEYQDDEDDEDGDDYDYAKMRMPDSSDEEEEEEASNKQPPQQQVLPFDTNKTNQTHHIPLFVYIFLM